MCARGACALVRKQHAPRAPFRDHSMCASIADQLWTPRSRRRQCRAVSSLDVVASGALLSPPAALFIAVPAVRVCSVHAITCSRIAESSHHELYTTALTTSDGA